MIGTKSRIIRGTGGEGEKGEGGQQTSAARGWWRRVGIFMC
jgi:hypothetical protein